MCLVDPALLAHLHGISLPTILQRRTRGSRIPHSLLLQSGSALTWSISLITQDGPSEVFHPLEQLPIQS